MSTTTQMEVSKNCLACNKHIRGRTDKKFCDDYCRSAYNNKLAIKKNSQIRVITNALRKNRVVLEKWATKKRNPVNLHELLTDGLNLIYFTQVINQPLSNPICYCYDYGYQLLPDNKCRIFKPKHQN